MISNSLLVVERVVLESLEKKEQSLSELRDQTGFSSSLLSGVLQLLLSKSIITKSKQFYALNWDEKNKWIGVVQNQKGVHSELRELLSVMIEQEKNKSNIFKFKKVWLEPSEKEELERKWKEIESYMLSIKEKRKRYPVRERTIGKQVVFFGVSPYESLVEGVIQSA